MFCVYLLVIICLCIEGRSPLLESTCVNRMHWHWEARACWHTNCAWTSLYILVSFGLHQSHVRWASLQIGCHSTKRFWLQFQDWIDSLLSCYSTGKFKWNFSYTRGFWPLMTLTYINAWCVSLSSFRIINLCNTILAGLILVFSNG